MNFRKNKGGHSKPKNFVADFSTFRTKSPHRKKVLFKRNSDRERLGVEDPFQIDCGSSSVNIVLKVSPK